MRHTVATTRTTFLTAALAILAVAGGSEAFAQTLSPLVTFGSNGWLAPGSNPYLTTTNTERGMGWNPVTKNLVLPSRNNGNFVAIINGTTGIVSGTLDTTGVSGGTLAMMGAGVSSDGAIYVSNLASGTTSSQGTFKIYKWASESDTSAPTTAFSSVNPGSTTGSWRFGDAFDVYGSGTAAKFASAGTTSGSSGGLANNGNFMIGQLDGSNANTIYRAIPNTLTASNDYRLSVAFVDADTIIGNQGASAKFTDFVAATTLSNTGAIVTGSVAIGAADRPLGYTVLNGQALMAVVNSNSALISVYDVTNPAAATLLVTGSTVQGSITANVNGTGALQWGEVLSPTSQVLYAMSTNQGIQAMVFQAVPEPSTYAMMGGAFAVIGVIASRKRKVAA
jgi:hypothetical protein